MSGAARDLNPCQASASSANEWSCMVLTGLKNWTRPPGVFQSSSVTAPPPAFVRPGRVIVSHLNRILIPSKVINGFEIKVIGAISATSISKSCALACTASSTGISVASGSTSCCTTDLCNVSGGASIKASSAAIILALGSLLTILRSLVISSKAQRNASNIGSFDEFQSTDYRKNMNRPSTLNKREGGVGTTVCSPGNQHLFLFQEARIYKWKYEQFLACPSVGSLVSRRSVW
ncbi:unnamed protein product [Ranitomeya imitator]|uniref:Snake toxin/toxin-like domain-containing protein n=1 Tax=Ranitomeya imitator TaxID=111125 RepID=A0ABN9M7Q0_9NEOB|nr:unnamed protein product [Ranitomeya imitator]